MSEESTEGEAPAEHEAGAEPDENDLEIAAEPAAAEAIESQPEAESEEAEASPAGDEFVLTPPSETEPRARRAPRERRITDRSEMEAAIEAILFVSSEPIPRARLFEMFDEEERPEAEGALAAILERFGSDPARGFMAEEVAGGIRFATRPELVGWLRRFFEVSAGTKLSVAALETLAIVAYRQPVTGPEIQELRGVSAVGVLKTLLERRLIKIAGRKEVVGKPFLYSTTREFLVHFGLKSLGDLPPLEELEETFGAEVALGPAVDSFDDLPGLAPPGSELSAEQSAADEARERDLLAEVERIEEREERAEAEASIEAGSRT